MGIGNLKKKATHMINRITIKKSPTADTRTCDWSKVTKEQLLEASLQHISDVDQGLTFLINMLLYAKENHDRTKISHIDLFHKDFASGFKTTEWWEMHQKQERHHFNNKEYVQDDVNLIDILEQLIDGVVAGMARSGQYRDECISPELLKKAYDNTVHLLLKNIKVLD